MCVQSDVAEMLKVTKEKEVWGGDVTTNTRHHLIKRIPRTGALYKITLYENQGLNKTVAVHQRCQTRHHIMIRALVLYTGIND